MTDTELDLSSLIKSKLHLVRKAERYCSSSRHLLYGHCHTASLAFYKQSGGKAKGYKLQKAVDDLGEVHYWIRSPSGEIIDLTKEQYTDLDIPLPYDKKKNDSASYLMTKSCKQLLSLINK